MLLNYFFHRLPLWAMLFDDRADIKRQDLNQTDDNKLD